MKILELLFETEARFKTGVGTNTIANPAALPKDSHTNLKTWEGNPNDFNFKKLQSQYTSLKTVLARNDMEFTYMGAAMYKGAIGRYDRTAPNITRFVVISKSLIWERYVGDSPRGAQNRVYVANQMMNTSEFLLLGHTEQDDLVKGNESTPVDELFRKYFKFTGKYSYTNSLINVDGDCELIRKVNKLPIKFGTVNLFLCNNKKLTSLENSPKIVKRDFHCANNQLTNLIGGPEQIGAAFNCRRNPLQSLEGLPKSVEHIVLSYNRQLPLLKLLFVENLKSLYIDGSHDTEHNLDIDDNGIFIKNNDSPSDIVSGILTKYLRQGRRGAILCAAELTKAGFKENAKL